MPHISLAQIEVLRTLLRRLSMENLDLGNDQVMIMPTLSGAGGRSERADEFIKRRTARWREIWLERPLALLIADLGAMSGADGDGTTRSTGAAGGSGTFGNAERGPVLNGVVAQGECITIGNKEKSATVITNNKHGEFVSAYGFGGSGSGEGNIGSVSGVDTPPPMKLGDTFTGEVTDNTGKKFRIYGKAEE